MTGVGPDGPRILVIGRSGQLAVSLAATPWPAGTRVVCRGREAVDLADPDSVRTLVAAEAPAVIVNAAAYTAVDRAESEAGLAFAVNRDGPAHLALAADGAGVPLIHVSTDYVFDGARSAPYLEDDPIAPLGVYGASKAAGEQAVRERLAAQISEDRLQRLDREQKGRTGGTTGA
jgi:dTDP-4-dehydrorhamnose reductase